MPVMEAVRGLVQQPNEIRVLLISCTEGERNKQIHMAAHVEVHSTKGRTRLADPTCKDTTLDVHVLMQSKSICS
jgi:hypothetical protein